MVTTDPDHETKGNQEPLPEQAPDPMQATWGPKLFLGTLVALLGFFYWLLIYSGGATGHHG